LTQQKARILFVDDHEDTRFMVTTWLGRMGYQVIEAGSVNEGLRLARQGGFDLYLLDSHFADGTGADLCAQIRAFDAHTPIIFYTGEHPSRLAEALACHVQGYVMKPELDALPEEIARALHTA
jgi:CheY-like chemotaxis protein